MGRRLRFASEFERWREAFLAGIADEHGDEFAAEVADVLAEEVEAFGAAPADRDLLAVIAEARAVNNRRAA